MCKLSIFSVCIMFLLIPGQSAQDVQEASKCKENGECPSYNGNCKVPLSRCATPASLYSRGGSAQAYKPHAPVKSEVCKHTTTKHRMATWFLRRSSWRSAPQIKVHLKLHECTGIKESQCCCTPRGKDDLKIEVWQTKPDGSYSSITPGREEGFCRATLEDLSFTTLAPGSTGIFGGLGPSGWDFAPYGPPVINMLFSTEDYEPQLVHLPIVLDKDLQSRHFSGPDWRGPGLVTYKQLDEKFSITKWKVYENDKIEIDVNIYLIATKSSDRSLTSWMCPSKFYGLPSSFFLEPISVCASYLLDYFPL